jgi:hypothetical protein
VFNGEQPNAPAGLRAGDHRPRTSNYLTTAGLAAAA